MEWKILQSCHDFLHTLLQWEIIKINTQTLYPLVQLYIGDHFDKRHTQIHDITSKNTTQIWLALFSFSFWSRTFHFWIVTFTYRVKDFKCSHCLYSTYRCWLHYATQSFQDSTKPRAIVITTFSRLSSLCVPFCMWSTYITNNDNLPASIPLCRLYQLQVRCYLLSVALIMIHTEMEW